MKARVKVVVQRFHKDVVGGAETYARRLVEKLNADGRFSVEVVTTTALDYSSWAPVFSEGESIEDGVCLRRFHAKWTRAQIVQAGLMRLLICLRKIGWKPQWLERLWVIAQGPFVPGLPKYLAQVEQETDLFLFFTYLYYPTLLGMPRVAHKSVLLPTAHDEPPFYLSLVSNLFEQAPLVFANTDEEAKVIKRVHQVAESKIHVGAAGIEVKPTLFQKSDPSSTVLFFAGRVGPSKGLDILISMLTRINQGRERPYILRLAGRMEEGFKLPRLGWIQYLGHISQELFDQQLRECLAVINPSEFESLSLLALEALASGTPVVLNSKCAVLKQYCEATPLAIGYSTELELKSCLSEAENIRKKEDYFRELQCKTALWIDEHLSWNPVVGRLLQQLKFN